VTAWHAAVLRAGGLEVTIVPSLACVCTSLRHEGDELIWQRAELDAYAHGALTGIPFLHPWANRLVGERIPVAGREIALGPETPVTARDPNGIALHGLQARALPFVVTAAGDSWLSASLDAADAPDLLAAFPFEHRLDLALSLDPSGLTVGTTLVAGTAPVPVAFGYHPFFQIPGTPRTGWAVELPLARRVPLDERLLPVGEELAAGDLSGQLGQRTFDDLYTGPLGALALEGGGRRIELRLLEGYDFVQVWASPAHDAVSFEPMTAPANALASGRGLRVLGPGARHHASFRVGIA
jgi:aldose 1-epimerase